MSDADTLREYWSGQGHAGPSHGAERDAIRWGTPGDFDRCVTMVTTHGGMTEDQAKGYCNLRHHDALGQWPAQHAQQGGKTVVTELDRADQALALVSGALTKASGSQEARVPAGSATGGQWTAGSDGPSTAPAKPNPFRKGGPLSSKPKKTSSSGKPSTPRVHLTADQRQQVAGIRAQIADLRVKLTSLYAERAKLSATGVSNFGTASTVKPATSTAAKPASTTAKPATTKPASSTSTTKPASSTSTSAASAANAEKIQELDQEIADTKEQMADLRSQITDIRSGAASKSLKSARNPRDRGSGQFRTFTGEVSEAGTAIKEGRHDDAIDLLSSARVLAPGDRERAVVGNLQEALTRVRHVKPDLTKS